MMPPELLTQEILGLPSMFNEFKSSGLGKTVTGLVMAGTGVAATRFGIKNFNTPVGENEVGIVVWGGKSERMKDSRHGPAGTPYGILFQGNHFNPIPFFRQVRLLETKPQKTEIEGCTVDISKQLGIQKIMRGTLDWWVPPFFDDDHKPRDFWGDYGIDYGRIVKTAYKRGTTTAGLTAQIMPQVNDGLLEILTPSPEQAKQFRNADEADNQINLTSAEIFAQLNKKIGRGVLMEYGVELRGFFKREYALTPATVQARALAAVLADQGLGHLIPNARGLTEDKKTLYKLYDSRTDQPDLDDGQLENELRGVYDSSVNEPNLDEVI